MGPELPWSICKYIGPVFKMKSNPLKIKSANWPIIAYLLYRSNLVFVEKAENM